MHIQLCSSNVLTFGLLDMCFFLNLLILPIPQICPVLTLTLHTKIFFVQDKEQTGIWFNYII